MHHTAHKVFNANNATYAFKKGLPDRILPQPTPKLRKVMSKQMSTKNDGFFSEDSVNDNIPTNTSYSQMTDFNKFRVDESGFSSGDSSSTDSDIGEEWRGFA